MTGESSSFWHDWRISRYVGQLFASANRASRIAKYAIALLCLTGASLCAYHVIWGRLMPFSPIVVGFKHQDTARARVYFQDNVTLSQFAEIDHIIAGVEQSHGIKFLKRVEILACGSDQQYRRLTGTAARFCVLPLYARVFVSRRALQDAQNASIHLSVYLRHELSHALLFQQMTLLNALRCPDWLLEGLAVFRADQRGVDGYYTKDEIREKMRDGIFMDPSDFITKPWIASRAMREFSLPNKYWFLYSEMACFVEDLIQSQGEDKFSQFLEGIIIGKNTVTLFQSVYGESWDTQLQKFRERMQAANQFSSRMSVARWCALFS